MTLHLFVNTATEILVHAFHGTTADAERFMKHAALQRQPARHIKIDSGNVEVADDDGVVVK